MPTTIQVQTDHYTDDGSHPVKFLVDNEQFSEVIMWKIPDELDRASVRLEFECLFFGIEGWQLLAPKTLCVFTGRVMRYRDDDYDHLAFKGEITTVEIPGWGEW